MLVSAFLIFIITQLLFRHPGSKGISPVDKTPVCSRTIEQQVEWSDYIYEIEIVKSEHKFDGMDFCIYTANLHKKYSGKNFIGYDSINLVFDPLKPSAEFEFSKDCFLEEKKKIALIRKSNRKYYQICQQIILVDFKNKNKILEYIK